MDTTTTTEEVSGELIVVSEAEEVDENGDHRENHLSTTSTTIEEETTEAETEAVTTAEETANEVDKVTESSTPAEEIGESPIEESNGGNELTISGTHNGMAKEVETPIAEETTNEVDKVTRIV